MNISTFPHAIESRFSDDNGKVTIHKFKIVRKLGEGGMGTVYLAENLNLPASVLDAQGPFYVALKFINPDLGEEGLARFYREYALARRVNHPNFVSVLDLLELADGNKFIVMEYVEDAKTLRVIIDEYLPSGKVRVGKIDGSLVPLPLILCLFTDALNGLEAVQDEGNIHRDLKPENILKTMRNGETIAKVSDLGIAKSTDPAAHKGMPLTRENSALGTPYYMAPEQIASTAVMESDLWAFGVCLFECVTGELPFIAVDFPLTKYDFRIHVNEVMARIAEPTIPPRSIEEFVTGVDPDVAQVIRGCLQHDPAARPIIPQIRVLLERATSRLMRHTSTASRRETLEAPASKPPRSAPLAPTPSVEEVAGVPRRSSSVVVSIVVVLALLIGVLATVVVTRSGTEHVASATPPVPQGMPVAKPAPPPRLPPPPPPSAAPIVEPVASASASAPSVPVAAVPKRTPQAGPTAGSEDDALYQKGLRDATSGQCRAAERELLAILVQYPALPKPMLGIAECALRRGQRARALDYALQYLEFEGTNPNDFSQNLHKLVDVSANPPH